MRRLVTQQLSSTLTKFCSTHYLNQANIRKEIFNPSQFIVNLGGGGEGSFYQAINSDSRLQFSKIADMHFNNKGESNISVSSKPNIIVVPGANSHSKVEESMVRGAPIAVIRKNVFGKNPDLGNLTNVISYRPRYSAGERFTEMLRYYLSKTHISPESIQMRNEMDNILLAPGNIILNGFSMGGHEIYMYFTDLIERLRAKGCSDTEILSITNRVLVFNIGVSINWHCNPNAYLYPRVINFLAPEDEGIKHLPETVANIHFNRNIIDSEESSILINKVNGDIRDMVVISPIGGVALNLKDKTHNITSYYKLVEQSGFSKILKIFHDGDIQKFEAEWKEVTSRGNICIYDGERQFSDLDQEYFARKLERKKQEAKEFVVSDDGDRLIVTLADDALSRFKEHTMKILDLNPYDPVNRDEIIKIAGNALNKVLPKGVKRALDQHAKGSPYRRKMIVIKGFPNSNLPSLTDQGDVVFNDPDQLVMQKAIIGLLNSELLSSQIMVDSNIASATGGVSNIMPTRKNADKHNANSKEPFDYHSEVAHWRKGVGSFILSCVRGSEVVTSFTMPEAIYRELPKWVCDSLREETFEFYGGDVVKTAEVDKGHVLSFKGEEAFWRFNMNPNRVLPLTLRGREAWEYFCVKMKDGTIATYELQYEAGDCGIVSDIPHGRGEIEVDVSKSELYCDVVRFLLRIHVEESSKHKEGHVGYLALEEGKEVGRGI